MTEQNTNLNISEIRPNLNNVTRGFEMIKYEVHQQDKKINELKYLLDLKNAQISKLENQLEILLNKYNTLFISISRLSS